MTPRGLLLDCDGVLTEIELDGHLNAFNRVWAEEGVAWQWTRDQYAAATARTSGGQERLLALAESRDFLDHHGPVGDAASWRATTLRWHHRKTQILGEQIRRDGVVARPGVRRLVAEARTAGWLVAVVSSGAPTTVDAIARQVLGDALADDLVVVAGHDVSAKKPDPECYRVALDRCGLRPAEAVAVEDNAHGLAAARGAGIPCLVTVTAESAAHAFEGAIAVVDCLGDTPHRPATALPHSRWRPQADEVRLADLARLAVTGSGVRDTPMTAAASR